VWDWMDLVVGVDLEEAVDEVGRRVQWGHLEANLDEADFDACRQREVHHGVSSREEVRGDFYADPRSPQQNRVAEGRIGLVMDIARTFMIYACAPHFPLPYAVRYAAHQLKLWPRLLVPPPLLFLAPSPLPDLHRLSLEDVKRAILQEDFRRRQEGRGAGGGRGRGRGGRGGRGGGAASMKSAGNESESRDDRFPGQFFFVSMQASAGPEKDEGSEEPAAVGNVTLHSLDYWVIDSGATYSMTPRADLLTELEPSLVKHVTSALGQRAEVKGMGKAMFKGADGKMVGLKNVLWVPNLAANLISMRSACVAKNRALTHVGADKWVPYVEWIGRKPKVDMLRVFGCMCMALVPKHLRHNKLGAKAIWAVHLGMAQNSKGWLLWDPFTKKFLVSRDCKFMENLMYKDWKAENEAKIGMRFGEVKGSGLEHVELPLELSSGSTTTRQSSLVNGGEEAKDGEEEEEEVQQLSERAPTLPSSTTSAPRIRVTPQQYQGLHAPAAEEEGWGKRRTQAPNWLTYEALGKPAKSALAGAALIVGDGEESDYEESSFAFFSPVKMLGEPATLKELCSKSIVAAIVPFVQTNAAAMDAEMASWKSTGTYVDEVPPPGANIVSGMWIFRGVEFFQTFSPTPKMTTLWVLLHVAAQRDYEFHSLDFSTAFLQGSLHEEIWLHRPVGFTGSFPVGTQWRLRRPVYDDLVFATADTEALAHVMSELQKRHTCTDLGELTSYLGLRITSDRAQRTITLTQSHMVQQVLQRFGFTYSSPQSTPLPIGHSLSAPPSEESIEPSGLYPELVGCLMYLMTCTRPDLAYPLSLLARYVAPGRHRKMHWDAAKRELRWLTYLLTDLGESPRSPPFRYVDNKAMLTLCQEHRMEHKTKQIALRYFLARELQQRGQLRLAYVASQANTADVFTKAFQPCDHQRFCTVLGLVPTVPHLLTS
ncbi:unnamed protein product, partial [Closterium sp. NIES-53]